MHGLFLVLHSILRWVVLLAGLAAVIQGVRGWLGGREWTALDNRLGLVFTSVLDVQLLVGVILYIVSPLIRLVFEDFGGAMGMTGLRFFAMEHVLLMVIAVVVAHVGRARIRRAPDAESKHKQAAIFFGLALVLVLAGIPWPFLPYGRPLLSLSVN
ncbi:MAG: hypothetical protein JXN59_06590 [Anaerolineae bacterium]|nr:hypothetical protein [Anaerolineae bacterium]